MKTDAEKVRDYNAMQVQNRKHHIWYGELQAKVAKLEAENERRTESVLAQTDSLIETLLNELNDVGAWGAGYREAMADLRRQLLLRF